jgi:broad specificity phosphatase PhoE
VADPARLRGLEASIVLVRHGETTWIREGRFQGSADPPLSDDGLRQAAAVAARLADPAASPAIPLPPSAPIGIWHSPLARAALVAAAIAGARGDAVPRHPQPDLLELGQGEWEGLAHHEVEARYPTELAAWRTDPTRHHAPGGESLADAAARGAMAAESILEALATAQRVATPRRAGGATVATGAPGRGSSPVLGYERQARATPPPWAIVVAHDGILRLVLARLLELPLERYWAFPFGLCAVTVVEIQAGRGRLRAHNLSDHLDR